ncbi:lipopolysaccharide export system protein lptC [Candidatus Photodesmus katoptron]|uniref:Lipopolysaccharide export system protein LptC n=1 Tax=Candidatus Photodesmus katoptron Akat1 TaxID=1236703 RepID=S3DFQ9_9GAMM|nr:LPS export ABC transporter periplasmic protein LptC [Candidatus Photodesmus katoptron]EPE37242.1 hypothetical protein O1U_0542 [Candidatus Photodesmus katoptron Akat1]KEY90101.1 lipopolysaccharide export system protein lptC [Candidatus Photodesmus katoptron]
MNLSHIVYIILILSASYSIYYLFEKKEEKINRYITSNKQIPMFRSKNMENIFYTEEGIRSHIITSKHLKYFPKSGETEFEFPVLKIYKNGQIQEWEISSDKALLYENRILTLYDNVLAKNLLVQSVFDVMSTKELNIELNNKNFWSHDHVVFIGQKFKIEGQEMKGNFIKNTAILSKKVKGQYEFFIS